MLLNSYYNYRPQIHLECSFKGVSSDIKNFQKVDEYLYRGGNPTVEQLQQLKAQGFAVIISFRTGYQGNDYNEAQVVKDLGMEFVHIPFISWENPSDEQVEKFFEVMEKARKNHQKVFIHCTHGKDRTGLFSAMYKLKYGIDNLAGCVQEMFKLGHNAEENPNLIPYLENYNNLLKRRI